MERDPGRIDPVLDAIRKIWVQYPDMRLGQLLVNAIRPADPYSELYNLEETTLIRKLENLAENLRKAKAKQRGQ